MKRTTIFADEDVLLELKQLAKAQKRTVTDLVRDALREYLKIHHLKPRRFSFMGIGSSDRTDLAEKAEEILAQEIDPKTGWS